ncbi:MAG: GNAT family N-acetyltransferase [Deltaproteobacteria bacterium]|nr:GNAT family N-acetyltransferase [Deltaproteobacteria bacterium]
MNASGTRVQPVNSPQQFKAFINFPWSIYRSDPAWVPPLKKEVAGLLSPEHPFFEHARIQLFLAFQNGQPVGRVAAIRDQAHIDYWKEEVVFFGFFESINDQSVGRALIDAVRAWAQELGIKTIRGPLNPSTNESVGLLAEGFDSPPFLMMPHNPPYYLDLIESAGLEVVKELPAFVAHLGDAEKVTAGPAARCRKRCPNFHLRPIRMKDLAQEVRIILSVYNQAWADNWGFVPMTDAEMAQMTKDLKQGVVPELVKIAYIDEEPIGMYVVLPDYNQALIHLNGRLDPFSAIKFLYYRRRIDRMRALLMGVAKEYRSQGLDMALIYDGISTGLKHGFKFAEASWILEDNKKMMKTAARFGRIHKRYRVYEGHAD